MTPSELRYVRKTILKLSQQKLADKMGYKSKDSIGKMERPGATIPGYFVNHLNFVCKEEGQLMLIPEDLNTEQNKN